MIVDVEVTEHPSGRVVARMLLWPDVVVEAGSRAEALAAIQAAIQARRETGIEIVQLAVDEPSSAAPGDWRKHAGAFADDELYQQMLHEVQRQRMSDDAADPT